MTARYLGLHNQNICFADFFVLDKTLEVKGLIFSLHQNAQLCTPRDPGVLYTHFLLGSHYIKGDMNLLRDQQYPGDLYKCPNSERRD